MEVTGTENNNKNFSEEGANLIKALLSDYSHIFVNINQTGINANVFLKQIIDYHKDIISYMPGNVYWLDRYGNAVGCNHNVLKMFGFSVIEEFLGLTFEDMGKVGGWSDAAIQAFKTDTLAVIESGVPKLNIEEPPIPYPDGQLVQFLTSRVPLFDNNKNVIGVVGISVDITELKNTQKALKEAKEEAEIANYAKSEFIANFSHDVKTPLAGIIGVSELLSYRLEGENHKLAQALLISGRQLLDFFDNCLEVFKLENSNIAFFMEPFNLEFLLSEVKSLFFPVIAAKKLTLTIDYSPDLPKHFVASRAAIYRILINLIGNAVKFTPYGSIRISLTKIGMQEANVVVQIKIIDSGIGIALNKLELIFDRFTRLVPSYKGTYEGSGVGLYIVKKFVTAMGGEVEVVSEEGKGSQFTVMLPLQVAGEYEHPAEEVSSIISLEQNQHTLYKKKSRTELPNILLVEDNLIAQRMQASLLTPLTKQLDVVDDGEEALAIFSPGKYDLVLLDIGLPGIQGDAVAKQIRIREQSTPYHVPIVAITAHVSEDIKNHCRMACMEGMLSKPLSREIAEELIQTYCYFTQDSCIS